MRNKKTVITITSIVAVLLVIIGVTYAYWLLTKTQTGHNLLSSGCLDISLTGEKNDIELQDQFPLSDEDGMKLTPYEFTVTNNCTTSVDYQVNLESIGDSTNAIKASAIKVALNDEIKLLTAGGNTEPTVSGAYESNMILYGTLAGSSEDTSEDTVTYELRIWIDENAPISEQNKTFQSKISVTIGQGVTNPYKEGTLAYDIISDYGGTSSITSLSAEWVEDDSVYNTPPIGYPTELLTADNSFYWGTDYTLNSESGRYSLSGNIVQASANECLATEGLCGKYTFFRADNSSTSDANFVSIVSNFDNFSENVKTVYSKNDFSKGISSSDSGLYKAQDDLGTSYYFRGNVENNYVKFGEYNDGVPAKTYYAPEGFEDVEIYQYSSYEECMEPVELGASWDECKLVTTPAKNNSPIYWRIVRINGDGTIRMVSEDIIETMSYNDSDNRYQLVDETGATVDSKIKIKLDSWYPEMFEKKYDKFIADGIFCNEDKQKTGANLNPNLKCQNSLHKYTVSKAKGNGLLTFPIGLLSIDETIFAGSARVAPNVSHISDYYLSKAENIYFWTFSPSGSKNVFRIYNEYYSTPISSTAGVRPVINLKADVKFTGDGSFETPYEIVIE